MTKTTLETPLMQRSLNEIRGYTVRAKDRDIGKVHDWYFSDRFWGVRHVVVDTGNWLPGRKVLISPAVCGNPSWEQGTIDVDLHSDKIKSSPPADLDKPVSRQYEEELARHYGWPTYWAGMDPLAAAGPAVASQTAPRGTPNTGDESLRSLREVTGYDIATKDGKLGHVEDFIAEEGLWKIRFMVVDTRNWLPGRKVLVSPDWIDRVDWTERSVSVDLTRDQVKNSPPYDPSLPVNRRYEQKLYDYYGRPHYWA